MSSLKTKTDFIKFISNERVLEFGEFTLKSGRSSPYFFNIGRLNSGRSLNELGDYYAKTVKESGIQYDLIFGPAYKGIPLAVATSISLYKQYGQDVPYIINRKEAKLHGEGGIFIGATDLLQNPGCRVLVIDDVITAGTAIYETFRMLQLFPNCQIVGVVISLDREEPISDQNSCHSAVSFISNDIRVPIISIAKFSDLIEYIEKIAITPASSPLCPNMANEEILTRMKEFRKQYRP